MPSLLRLHSNGRRLERFNGRDSPSRRFGGTYWATFSSSVLRRLLLQRCLRASAFLRLPGNQRKATALAVASIVVGGALYAFDQEWRFYEIMPLFSVTPVCAAAILLKMEFVSCWTASLLGLWLCCCWFRSGWFCPVTQPVWLILGEI